ncbi:hypothetical protein OK346_08580 [Streptococcus pneumoniae]|uniref:hypothetical protein n=1 Tax=Streptococcus pneumoniae TaxID=1313 RepID=UPI002151DE40|nr:hypothetical protein [Streptococcus pneumoniae]MDG7186914.1 hypothetical protein [Streptococcus pneumoniae]MDG7443142.1 hypothetical protein [Streptococcus pneumoniae]MDG7622015.1 hypothetical protein [Streptococcus pneumoniae]MDG7995852.1 hypothetical protein [Streptococcus pneumoniae]MDG8981712.1 hypothetical protein [Streptococcus pneumoniae]
MRLWIELTKSAQNSVFEVVDETDEVSNHTYGKAKLTWFEEIFEEYKMMGKAGQLVFFDVYRLVR